MVELPSGRMSGATLRAVITAMRHTPAKHLIGKVFRAQLGIEALAAEFSTEMCAQLPQSFWPLRARTDHRRSSLELDVPRPGEAVGARQLAEAFASGLSPLRLTELVLDALPGLDERTPAMNPFLAVRRPEVLEEARASEQRHRAGKSLGPLDGVIVPVKEEVDVAGLPTRLGTGWMAAPAAERDSAAVARLRAAGALVVGNTVMTEYGMSPLGTSPHRKMPRNVYDPGRVPGGSSTGSAVAVALGLAPVALGLDGGGSIRVPAAYNGLFGLKPTYGRVPLVGHGAASGSSVVHIGPIGCSTEDLALFLEASAGPADEDTTTFGQPELVPGELRAALARGVKGLRIGIDEGQWDRAPAEIAKPCREALEALRKEGAELIPVRTRLAPHAAAIGYLTIGLESFAALREVRKAHFHELAADLQLTLAALEQFRPDDYISAQRLRGELRRETAGLLREVDVLALPTTANLPPRVSDSEARGFVDPKDLDELSRYVYLGNLTGIPAGTAPVGFVDGLPVGLQILGDAWDEACVLQVLAHLERMGVAAVRRPPGYLDLLASARAAS